MIFIIDPNHFSIMILGRQSLLKSGPNSIEDLGATVAFQTKL
jgi:hypothetical protein